MFDAIFNLLNRAGSLNQDSAVAAMDNPENLETIVKLNTERQLFDEGVDSEGVPLEEIGGDYSPATKRYKASQGQRFDHVTLNDTGDFYRSETAEFDHEGNIILRANTIKDGEDLQSRWGDNILGLTDKSIEEMKPKFKDDIIKDTRTFLQG